MGFGTGALPPPCAQHPALTESARGWLVSRASLLRRSACSPVCPLISLGRSAHGTPPYRSQQLAALLARRTWPAGRGRRALAPDDAVQPACLPRLLRGSCSPLPWWRVPRAASICNQSRVPGVPSQHALHGATAAGAQLPASIARPVEWRRACAFLITDAQTLRGCAYAVRPPFWLHTAPGWGWA